MSLFAIFKNDKEWLYIIMIFSIIILWIVGGFLISDPSRLPKGFWDGNSTICFSGSDPEWREQNLMNCKRRVEKYGTLSSINEV